MAGIGFALRRLARQESLSSVLAAAGHAAVIVAGPWLFTIFSLGIVTLLTEDLAGRDTLASFRVLVIYAFATSLVLTAPITIVATRLVADALWLRRPEDVPGLLFASFLYALAVVAIGVLALIAFFGVPGKLALPLLAASLVVALIWVALCFCGAVRDYAAVTLAFLVGLLAALLASVLAAVLGHGAAGMAWGFTGGLLLTFLGLTVRVLATFPHPVTHPAAGLAALHLGLVRYGDLALGALAGALGVWIDKWLMWFSPAGEAVNANLVHAPLYDSAMFIASLTIIPALAAFVVRLETDFFERYQHYYGTIQAHGTYRQIETARARLMAYTFDNLVLVTVAQVGLCALIVLIAPLIIDTLSLQFTQIAILRYGAMGSVFHFVFIAATSLLVFFDRRGVFLALQVLFLALNGGLTGVTLALGEDFYGVGYFLAAIISGGAALVMADLTFTRLNFLTFIANNPSIVPAQSEQRRRRPWR